MSGKTLSGARIALRLAGLTPGAVTHQVSDAVPKGSVVTTQPASKSQQNVQRRGFDLLYTRAVLVSQSA